MQLPFLCDKPGAIALVLLGLTASRLAVSQSDEIVLNLEFLNLYTG